MKNKNGFTLIELLAVVVIIAIIATVGIYTISKIINKARINTLNDTAMAVKKAVGNMLNDEAYINSEWFDITPGGDGVSRGSDAGLVELSKDPWGDAYLAVLANVIRGESANVITLYLFTKHGDYVLDNGAIELRSLAFEVIGLSNNLSTGNINTDVNYEFTLPNAYEMDDYVIKVLKNGSAANLGADYVIKSKLLTKDINNKYNFTLTLKTEGNYSISVSATNAHGGVSDYSQTVSTNIEIPPLALPGTLYFNNVATTVNGLAAKKLDSATTGASNGIGLKYGAAATIYGYLDIYRRTNAGVENQIASKVAPVTIPYNTGNGFSGVSVLFTGSYNFPGWSGGNLTDALVVKMSLATSPSGAPFTTQIFITAQLNTTKVSSSNWSVNYYVSNDNPWDGATGMLYFGTTNNKIVIN